jgi:UMF1 family MFS transporter
MRPVSTSRLGFANGLAGVLVALAAPVLGAMADRAAGRKRQLLWWTGLGVLGTAALGFIGQGDWQWAAAAFVIAGIGFNASIIFYDALLLDVAPEFGIRHGVRTRLFLGLPRWWLAVRRERADDP